MECQVSYYLYYIVYYTILYYTKLVIDMFYVHNVYLYTTYNPTLSLSHAHSHILSFTITYHNILLSLYSLNSRTGTGKTATVLASINKLRSEVAAGTLPDFAFIEINCLRLKGPTDACEDEIVLKYCLHLYDIVVYCIIVLYFIYIT